MNLDFNLNLTQQQKLVMTQQMQLSVKLLQMSNYELLDYVNKEVQENPVVDIEPSDVVQEKSDEIDYNKLSQYLESDNYNSGEISRDNEEVSPFNFISEQKSLKDFLKDQIIDLLENDYIKSICFYIIECINSSGYLTENIDELSEILKADKKYVYESLDIVQSLEPVGVGARNLKECLKIQAEKRGILDKNLQDIIDEYLEDIAENRYNKIAKDLNITIQEAQAYGDRVKAFEPKPSRGFYTGDETEYIIPDAYIKQIEDKLYIIMNDNFIPKLSINNLYKNILNDSQDEDAKKYVKEKINGATFLIKSIDMRRNTIYKVIEQIVNIQRDYFLNKDSYLKPMTLKDISERINMHESTISRAIKEKYINTDRGIIKIKDLFTTSVSNNKEEDLSTVKIKNYIKDIIDKEDKSKPISDQDICNILKSESMGISRRTVAKYRDELGIKSSSKRKRF
ncbi:MAG: RNA polymerase factor sigma-54 [Clostridium sp.]|uniref:RNA polymerase factor sigma-54 n=1 Tax=Clostridium sp. TaxID=1506 RepID=UPI0039E7AE48